MSLPGPTAQPITPSTAERVTPSLNKRTPWRALNHRNYVLFFIGHGLSLCGTWMQSLALAWLVYRLSRSPFLLGLVEFIARGPILVFGVVGGLFADRWPRHRLMVWAQSGLLLQAALLAALTLSGHITIGWILMLAFLLGLISALEIPVRQSFVADLVPRSDIPSAIGLNSSLFNAARVVGPSLAGILVATVGEGICFLINALSYGIILVCLYAMRLTPKSRQDSGDAWEQLREGLHYAWHTPHVRAVLSVTAVLSIAAMPYSTLLPVFARDILHGGPGDLGLLMAASGAGALAAALRHAGRQSVKGLGRSIARSVGLFGVGLLAFAASSSFWLSAAAMVAIGFGMVSSLAGINILLQSLVPDALRGRVVSLFATLSLGLTIFGSIFAGAGATYLPAPAIVICGGLITLLTAWLFWKALPAIRRHIREHRLIPADEVTAS
ncbi:MAG TPA: MFS transporter [Nitrospiraceae bacterium]|nr:MFS transporter [Nitrospiraceae bacterium]